jgi:S-adenosyl-L-methionine hydrolase (adenosine-forming)
VRTIDSTRSIVFVSDFGLESEWVGICHAVMTRLAPHSPIVDLSHFVETLNVEAGARLLCDSIPYLPEDAVVVAIVDPSVGADRDLAVSTVDGRLLVGPDNGLLAPAWSLCGGVAEAVEITSPEVILTPVAPSFHARDVLCPAAAHLASGLALDRLGPSVDPAGLATLELRLPQVEVGKIRCEVIDHNRFGNIHLNVRAADLAAARLDHVPKLSVEGLSGWVEARWGHTYADFSPGEYGVILDPRGWLCVVRGNPGNALEDLQLADGDLVWITSPDGEPG